MPRSKFATKNYGPTKPAICEKQHLPPGTLAKGPGEHNAVYFFLVLANTGGFLYPVAGSTVLTRGADPTQYAGLATVGDFTVAITLDADPPDYGPWFHWTVRKFGIWLFASSIFADKPRSIDPYVNPLIDTNRLFLTGGSYAGYLTAWIIGHDQRFKAAVAQRGVYDLTTFYGEGNAYRLVKNHFGGRPYEPETRRLLEEQSPFTYAKEIRTPFLIIHGNNDLRTGVTQSEMLYRALKDMGRPVEYVRYPNIGHELTRSGPPLQRMDHMLRIIEFFERYSSNDAPAPVGTN